MFQLFKTLVRVSYLIAIVVSLGFLVPWVLDGIAAMFRPAFSTREVAWRLGTLLPLALLLVAAARAIARVVRRAELISDGRIREAPIVSTLVLFSSVAASFLLLNFAWAVLTRAGRDIELAPFIFFGMIWLALSLLIGEIVLVGRTNR